MTTHDVRLLVQLRPALDGFAVTVWMREVASAWIDRLSVVPELNGALHVGGQAIPAGLLVTVPPPVLTPLSVRSIVSPGRTTVTGNVFVASVLPAMSVAKYVMDVTPSVWIVIVALALETTSRGPPFTAKLMDATPDPPGLSVACSVTVAGRLVTWPLASGVGETAAVVVGDVLSISIGPKLAELELPAWSVIVRVTD